VTRRKGQERTGDGPAPGVRVAPVVVRPEDRDEVYVAQVQRRGRGVCSGWADEEDYGPRYT
jgi:hypothetical protein